MMHMSRRSFVHFVSRLPMRLGAGMTELFVDGTTYNNTSTRSCGTYVPNARTIDLRSDVLTKPTKVVKHALMASTYNDDVFNEDETVQELQENVAAMFGMESALFVPSGTMGNLICMLYHCDSRGCEALLGDKAHLILYEQGGMAQLGGVHPRTIVTNPDGTLDLNQLESYIRPDDVHAPRTAVISIENTHSECGGKVLPIEYLARLRALADAHVLPVHMDGARVFNAAVALGVPPTEILQHVDTVSACLSKGIGAPVGSVIVGSSNLITFGQRMRKVLGGGWRKPGPLAAAALVSLQDYRPRMQKDHAHAKAIAYGIMEKNQDVVHIDPEGVHTNTLMINIIKTGVTAADFCNRLTQVPDQEYLDLGEKIVVKSLPFYKYIARMMTYSTLSTEQIDLALKKCVYVINEMHRK